MPVWWISMLSEFASFCYVGGFDEGRGKREQSRGWRGAASPPRFASRGADSELSTPRTMGYLSQRIEDRGCIAVRSLLCAAIPYCRSVLSRYIVLTICIEGRTTCQYIARTIPWWKVLKYPLTFFNQDVLLPSLREQCIETAL